MSPKKITLVDNEGGEVSKEKISSNEEYEKMLACLGVQSIKDNEGYNINGFESLEDGGRYTLGRHQKQRSVLPDPNTGSTRVSELQPYDPIPTNATGRNPLIVKGPLDQLQQERAANGSLVSEWVEKFKPALDYAQQQLEAKTIHKAMSVASYEFARLLLSGLSIDVKIAVPDLEKGSAADPPPYRWTVDTMDSKTIEKGEHQGTPGAREWFKRNFVGENGGFCLNVVTGQHLPTLKGNHRSTSGKGDLVVGIEAQLKTAVSPYEQAYGLVELKTDEYPLKPAQNVLELASLSTISRLGKSVAVLATDCNTKWELCYFKDGRTIQRRAYEHGRKCWEDFQKLLADADTRSVEEPPRSRYKQTLSTNFEESEESFDDDEQDLGGFGESDAKQKAVDNEAFLHHLANYLGDLYGERPVVPEWAQAKNTVSNFYL